MDRFASFTQQAAIPVFWIVAALVFFGVIDATGAPPGGLLSAFGFVGGILAIPVATVWAVYVVLLLALGWFSWLAIPMAIIGTLRRRARWYAIPVAVLLFVAGGFGPALGERVVNGLGSVSRFDAATYWGMFVAMWLVAVGQFPIWLRSFWRWTNTSELEMAGHEAL